MGNTFFIEKDQDNIDRKKRINIEVGDSKKEDFIPGFKSMHFNNECNFSAHLISDESVSKFEDKDGKITASIGDIEARFYEKESTETDALFKEEHGQFEFDIIFNQRPATNEVKFSIQSKNIVFFYQGELPEDMKKKGVIRPDNVVGSYAVYHATKRGGVYGSGKLFHIYRPYFIDAKGNKVWGEIRIEKGIMTISFDSEAWDNAAYPLIVDPTYGYTTVGANAYPNFANNTVSSIILGAAPSNDVCVDINFYGKTLTGGSGSWLLTLHEFDGSSTWTKVDEYSTTTGPNGSPFTITGPLSYTRVSGKVYRQSIMCDGGYIIYYDDSLSGSDIASYDDVRGSFANPSTTSPSDWTDYTTYQTTMYINTTAGGGGGSNIKSIDGVLNADIKAFNPVLFSDVKSIDGVTN